MEKSIKRISELLSSRQVILASQSQARKTLLEQAGVSFEVMASGLDEASYKEALSHDPAQLVLTLAQEKAKIVSQQFPEAVIIAADTIVVVADNKEQQIIGQAADAAQALSILQTLSDRIHYVLTGVAVLDAPSQQLVLDLAKTAVTFHPITAEDLQQYIDSGQWQGKAGAYGVQDESASKFIKFIDGDETNVWGLPMLLLLKMLKKF